MKELTQQELIRIYSSYFPYDLKVQHYDYEREIKSICSVVSLTQDEITIANSDHEYDCMFDDVKPILWDLSMLTKEIEHDGEIFIAKDKLFGNGHRWKHFKKSLNKNSLHCIEYWVIDKLIEWHFNIYNLEESQYINKATLKTK